MTREFEFVAPNIGHGNVATALLARAALINALVSGGNVSESSIVQPLMLLPVTSQLGRGFHTLLSRTKKASEVYTHKSESLRLGVMGKIFASLSGVELAARLLERQTANPQINGKKVLVFGQEHPLLGLTLLPEWLRERLEQKLKLHRVFVLPADATPKGSAVMAVNNSPMAQMLVWNPELKEGLEATPTQLVQSWYQQYFESRALKSDFADSGSTIVCKSSGGGMPKELFDVLYEALKQIDQDFVIHTPASRIGKRSGIFFEEDQPENTTGKIMSYLGDIGPKTRTLITPPNESIGMVAVLHMMGHDNLAFLCLKQQGQHEARNAALAQRLGIHRGNLAPKNVSDQINQTVLLAENGLPFSEEVLEFRTHFFERMRVATSLSDAFLEKNGQK